MTWVKHSDDFSSNPKVIGLSDKAYRLHFCALEYCSRHLTDGVVTKLALVTVGVTARTNRPKSIANSLVKAGLWKRYRGDRWIIHDFLEYNPKADVIKAERKKAAARMARLRAERSGGTSGGSSGGSSRSPSRPGSLSKDKGANTNGYHPDFECPQCGVDKKSQSSLEEHMELVHT